MGSLYSRVYPRPMTCVACLPFESRVERHMAVLDMKGTSQRTVKPGVHVSLHNSPQDSRIHRVIIPYPTRRVCVTSLTETYSSVTTVTSTVHCSALYCIQSAQESVSDRLCGCAASFFRAQNCAAQVYSERWL